MTSDRFTLSRRQLLGAGLATLPMAATIAQTGELVVGAAQAMTGVFAFAGTALHQALGDYCDWRNARGGVAGRRLRYIVDDSAYRVDQAMAVFKRIVGAHKAPVF